MRQGLNGLSVAFRVYTVVGKERTRFMGTQHHSSKRRGSRDWTSLERSIESQRQLARWQMPSHHVA